jgi:hypothetical protein
MTLLRVSLQIAQEYWRPWRAAVQGFLADVMAPTDSLQMNTIGHLQDTSTSAMPVQH